MSEYSIVLNIRGNASRTAKTLAKDLMRADAAASSLASSLTRVAGASHAIKSMRLPTYYQPRGYVNATPAGTNYTRHKNTQIASFGTGVNFGPFSGRLSTIIQPNAAGKILGIDAATLMKSANITALVGTIIKKLVVGGLKLTAATTLAPIAIGGGSMMLAIRALQSESFAEGVRLISRRHQARQGLGAEFERGQSMADFLSQSYGFDRSTTLSSLNTMTGMGIGGGKRVLTLSEATGLTKVGGLISQQSGAPFERVMTNIQQLLVQTQPNMRDIRELLNQAPILGKYAIKDMREKGVTGVDVRSWFKDPGHLLTALKNYEADFASNAGMQTRGQIALALQDFWATIAGNNKFWRFIGTQGASTIGSAGSSINMLMTSLVNSTAFKNMSAEIEAIFDVLGMKGETFIGKLTTLVDGLAQRFGLGGDVKHAARTKVGRNLTLEALMADDTFKQQVLAAATTSGLFKDLSGDSLKEKQNTFLEQVTSELERNKEFMATIRGDNILARKTSIVDTWQKGAGLGTNLTGWLVQNTGVADFNKNQMIASVSGDVADSVFRRNATLNWLTDKIKTPDEEYAGYDINKNTTMKYIEEYLKKAADTGSIPTNLGGGDDGKSLTGMNKDRRSLQINFNAPIVEWTNTMETSSPEETVKAVAENIEEIASAAIQKALLGASNKMSTRWY